MGTKPKETSETKTDAKAEAPVVTTAEVKQEAPASVAVVTTAEVKPEEAPAPEVKLETTPAPFPLSSTDSAFAIRESEAPAYESPTLTAVEHTHWHETHRIVTADSTYLVMIVDFSSGDDAYAWTQVEYNSRKGTPSLVRDNTGAWLCDGVPFMDKIQSLTA